MIEQAPVIIHIERSPATIVTLHAEEPGEASLTGFFQDLLVGTRTWRRASKTMAVSSLSGKKSLKNSNDQPRFSPCDS